MKILFILNPSKSEKMWDLREAAGRAAQRIGDTARFGQVDRTSPDSLARLLRQGLEEGCKRVVVAGGDGTINRTINLLNDQKKLGSVDLAIVPAGTCNDFARSLGLSARRLPEAFEAACRGTPHKTDLGIMKVGGEQRLFLNNAGFGRRIPVTQKRTSTLRTLRSFQATQLKIRWEKGQLEGTFFMMLACNAPYFSKGLYFTTTPRANDEALDIYLVPEMPRWRLMALLLKGKLRRPINNRRVIKLHVQRLEVEADREIFPQMDGEPPVRGFREVAFAIAQEKVMIIVPERRKPLRLWQS